MSRRNPPAKWVLPETINPDTSICFVIPVPNERFHLAAFRGALQILASGLSWQDDPDHKAKDVARVWRDIVDELEHCDMKHWEVRLNPADCTEVQQFDNALMDYADVFSLRCSVDTVIGEQFPPNNPPGTTQPGPQPGGGNPTPGQCFTLKLQVSGFAPTLIPLNVKAGWTITTIDIQGATTDGFLAQLPPYISLWRCGDGGGLFQLGSCFGSTELITTDPIPTENHLIPIIQYPDSTYAPLHKGESFVVPSGMTDGFYQLLINNSPGAGTNPGTPAGALTVVIELCNSVACIDYDFTTGAHGFAPIHANDIDYAHLTGDGWIDGFEGGIGVFNQLQVFMNVSSIHVTSVTLITSCALALEIAFGGQAVTIAAGGHKSTTLTVNADLTQFRAILTTFPENVTGVQITLHSINICHTGA